MGKMLLLCLLCVTLCAIWALPLYLCVNFVLWVFHAAIRLTLLQAFSICLLCCVIKKLLGIGEKE